MRVVSMFHIDFKKSLTRLRGRKIYGDPTFHSYSLLPCLSSLSPSALIGFPSVGKSTLLNKITDTASATGAYEFTTLTAVPGNMDIQGSRVQLLDLPGIVEGASSGIGRGRQVVAVAKTADLIIIMMDATKSHEQRPKLEKELEEVGIRLNRRKPDGEYQIHAKRALTCHLGLDSLLGFER